MNTKKKKKKKKRWFWKMLKTIYRMMKIMNMKSKNRNSNNNNCLILPSIIDRYKFIIKFYNDKKD